MNKKITRNEVSLSNDAVFCEVMTQKEVAKRFLEELLKTEISDVEQIEKQMVLENGPKVSGVRLVARQKNGKKMLCNIELLTENPKDLERRNRFYQYEFLNTIRVYYNDFSVIPDTCVVFVCTFDYFGQGLAVYEAKNSLAGREKINVDTGSRVFFLNSAFTDDNASLPIGELLKLLQANNAAAQCQSKLAQAVVSAMEQTIAKNNLTDLQKKAIEIAQKYKNLSLQDKIGIIAQAFGSISGQIKTSFCSGKWRGTSDVFINFDNGERLYIGNHRTPQSKTKKVQTEFVDATLKRYNPEIIAEAKKAAAAALRKREAKDNEIAARKGLKPYTFINVEFEQYGEYIGWYYITLAVDGKIRILLEARLDFDIANGKVSETPKKADYYVAGAVKETDADFVFDNVGFSSASKLLYSPLIRNGVLERAKKTLAARRKPMKM